MPRSRVYLDAGGRAPLHPVAREAYDAATDEGWADPRRLHTEGRRARLLLDGAREALAAEVGSRTEDVHLAPGATVALHHGVLGPALARRRTGTGIVVSATERAAVHAAARFAAEREATGHGGPAQEPVTVVPVDRTGRVDLDLWGQAVQAPGVAVAVLQHANGEVGTRQPVAHAYEACRARGVPLVMDATSSLGHDTVGDHWDVLVADPADWGSTTGVGVLVTGPRTRLARAWPEDEDRWFPGGVSVPGAVAAAASLRAVVAEREQQDRHRRELVDVIRRRVRTDLTDVVVAGDPTDRLPHVVTFSLLYVDGEAILTALDRRGFAVGSGSACTTSTLEPSHVLRAMGVLTQGNVRVVLPAGTHHQDVVAFLDALPGAVEEVRRMIGAL